MLRSDLILALTSGLRHTSDSLLPKHRRPCWRRNPVSRGRLYLQANIKSQRVLFNYFFEILTDFSFKAVTLKWTLQSSAGFTLIISSLTCVMMLEFLSYNNQVVFVPEPNQTLTTKRSDQKTHLFIIYSTVL